MAGRGKTFRTEAAAKAAREEAIKKTGDASRYSIKKGRSGAELVDMGERNPAAQKDIRPVKSPSKGVNPAFERVNKARDISSKFVERKGAGTAGKVARAARVTPAGIAAGAAFEGGRAVGKRIYDANATRIQDTLEKATAPKAAKKTKTSSKRTDDTRKVTANKG